VSTPDPRLPTPRHALLTRVAEARVRDPLRADLRRVRDAADELLLLLDRLREAYARHAGAPYLWTERAGRGRVIAFAGDPNFRDLWHGLLPVFANAVFLGGTF